MTYQIYEVLHLRIEIMVQYAYKWKYERFLLKW